MAIVTGCHSKGAASFACAQAGCLDCLEALMQEHEGLVYFIVRQQEMGGVEFQELVQEGRIALWQSILAWLRLCELRLGSHTPPMG